MKEVEIISWLKRGKNRIKIFVNIDQHTTPSEIVGRISKNRGRKAMSDYAMVSRALNELKKKKLVRLMVKEETKIGRIYELTTKGKSIKKRLEID